VSLDQFSLVQLRRSLRISTPVSPSLLGYIGTCRRQSRRRCTPGTCYSQLVATCSRWVSVTCLAPGRHPPHPPPPHDPPHPNHSRTNPSLIRPRRPPTPPNLDPRKPELVKTIEFFKSTVTLERSRSLQIPPPRQNYSPGGVTVSLCQRFPYALLTQW